MIVESEPPTERQVFLAMQLVEAMELLEAAEAQVDYYKTLIAEETPNGTIVPLGNVNVIRGERKPHRKLNVVGLLRRGLPRDAFCTIKPSVTVFTEYAEKQEWSDNERDNYILPGGDPVPTVSVRPVRSTEEDLIEEN